MKLSDEIKKSVSCIDACRMYGIEVNSHGFARCPFHGEKTPSFKAYPGSRGFHCFGCGLTGSVIDLVMKLFDCSVGDACKRLNDDFRLNLIHEGNLSRSERIAQNREAWERQRHQKEIDEQHAKLITEWNDAIYMLRLVELAFCEAAPVDRDEEWSDCFVTAASRRDRVRARADEALEALEKFERERYSH